MNHWMTGLAYVGNKGSTNTGRTENPAVYIPGASTVGNTQQRRVYPNLRLHLEERNDGQHDLSLPPVESREALQSRIFDLDQLRLVQAAANLTGARIRSTSSLVKHTSAAMMSRTISSSRMSGRFPERQ